ncbi:RNA polymerase sigma factor [Ruminococcus sp.]|uniref:RNA polymerase sigma factor n=1 Tax=Ruminococcus sp. TaxID=41978 RepID=UPI0025F7673F|nr:RNA polymerase sigma factor [Ruminococcus sp.]
MDDTSIIELYWNRDEQAINETDKKYGKLCYRLAFNILKRREDSEECVNDTFMKAWNSIPPDRPTHFSAYLCQIVKRIALSKFRYNTADKRQCNSYMSYDELSEFVSDAESPEDVNIMTELSNSISNYLASESKQNRVIFIRRYWYFDSAEDIASAFHISPNTVWSILSRMRKRLKKQLQKEGYDL